MAKIAGLLGWRAAMAVAIAALVPVKQSAAAASLSGRDVQIIAKTLNFLDPARPGGMVAVIYDPGNPASRADAAAISALFGSGVKSGSGLITARALASGSLGNGGGYVAVILAAGAAGAATAASFPRGMLSITAVDAMVRAGRCIMAVHSQPRVEITVNRAAAQASGVGFTAAFGMLVHAL